MTVLKMNNVKKEPWILTGYSLFAKEGPEGLKIEAIAKRVGISKSSFYHHFADVHIFTDILLRFHLDRTKIIVQREKDCKSIEPELICVLLEYKQDLLFNRQLRIHRADMKFRKCVEASNRLAANAISDVWGKDLGLNRESE